MSEILTYVITSLITFLTTGGIGSIFYFKLQKKLKEAEVKAAEADVKTTEISNLSASNEEWIKLFKESEEVRQKLLDKLTDVYKEKDKLIEQLGESKNDCNRKDMVITELNWFRCEVNGCPYRKPPRKYGDMDFPKDAKNPIENPDPDYI